jgi:hypothetical protein
MTFIIFLILCCVLLDLYAKSKAIKSLQKIVLQHAEALDSVDPKVFTRPTATVKAVLRSNDFHSPANDEGRIADEGIEIEIEQEGEEVLPTSVEKK